MHDMWHAIGNLGSYVAAGLTSPETPREQLLGLPPPYTFRKCLVPPSLILYFCILVLPDVFRHMHGGCPLVFYPGSCIRFAFAPCGQLPQVCVGCRCCFVQTLGEGGDSCHHEEDGRQQRGGMQGNSEMTLQCERQQFQHVSKQTARGF